MSSRRITRTKRVFTVLIVLTLIVTAQLVLRQRAEADLDLCPPLIPSVLPAVSDEQSVIVSDPYAYPGDYHKAQLHMHTDRSMDGEWAVETAVRTYYEAGYTYLAIADHDQVTIYEELDGPDFVTIPTEENTVPWPFWPLGTHMLRLFVDSHDRTGDAQARIDSTLEAGGMAGICHPSWMGNMHTGEWTLSQMLALDGFQLVEVYNPHSNSKEDTSRWHQLIRRLGPDNPVWAIAVDDAHNEKLFNRGWVVVKTAGISEDALKTALKRGSFYPSTGPVVDFGVTGGDITVKMANNSRAKISFVAGNGEIVYVVTASEATYRPRGNEGFIRVEVETSNGKKAWSQPFWLEVGEIWDPSPGSQPQNKSCTGP